MAPPGRSEWAAIDQDGGLLYFAFEPVGNLTAGRRLLTRCSHSVILPTNVNAARFVDETPNNLGTCHVDFVLDM
jgi:hypothetical protein